MCAFFFDGAADGADVVLPVMTLAGGGVLLNMIFKRHGDNSFMSVRVGLVLPSLYNNSRIATVVSVHEGNGTLYELFCVSHEAVREQGDDDADDIRWAWRRSH